MEPSAPIIYKAILKFQALSVSVKKAGTNPAFHSKYMQLDDVLDAVLEPLNKLGVIILQTPQETALLTRLVAVEDGSSVDSYVPYTDVSTAQKLGGCITYARRYALVSMLGLNDADDDGASASAPRVQPARLVADNEQGNQITVKSVYNGTGSTGKTYVALTLDDGTRLFDNTQSISKEGVYTVKLKPDGSAVIAVLWATTRQDRSIWWPGYA